MSFQELLTSLQGCTISEQQEDVNEDLRVFYEKLSLSSRSTTKRSKERFLEEAVQLLKRVSTAQLNGLEENHLELFVKMLISLQLETVGISTAFCKIDQLLQQLAGVNRPLVYGEIKISLQSIIQKDQLSLDDLQTACMFLEDSIMGREVWQELCLPLMQKVAEVFTVIFQKESLRDGPFCYAAVKICLQIFQLLPNQVSSFVWSKMEGNQAAQNLLQALIDVIYGQCCNRDTCLLAGTAVAMLLNTSQTQEAEQAAWSLLQISHQENGVLTVGGLQVNCSSMMKKELAVLAMCRGVLTCCRAHILLSSNTKGNETSLLVNGLFSIIFSMCEKKLDCHFFAFEVFTLWLKKMRECLADIRKMTGVRLLSENSSFQQHLIHLILANADSPVDGVLELARKAFSQLLDLYQVDCDLSDEAERPMFSILLQRITKMSWENKTKYYQLCALLPYLCTDKVLQECPETPDHLLKCLSTNQLSPCGSELYKCLIQQQKRELQSHPEAYFAKQWAKTWKLLLIEALTSDMTILQNNGATHLLPSTFRVCPSAVEPLLGSLDPSSPSHLYAWACIFSSYRATVGRSPWTLQEDATLKILHLALESADDKVRLAAFNLLCCSPKTKECPTHEEFELLKVFIPQNLNCESSSFRQHFQSGLRHFLVRVRDCCLSILKIQKGQKKQDAMKQEVSDFLKQGIEFVDWLGEIPYCYLAQGHNYQRKKTALLILTAVLETCTDTWSPDKRKGQPPVNIDCLINFAKLKGQWDFFCRTKLLVLISCLEDSTNEIRELSANILMRFFSNNFPKDVVIALFKRTKELLCSPRVQEAQMAALMIKVLQQISHIALVDHVAPSYSSNRLKIDFVRFLLNELEVHYSTAKSDMMLAARTRPIHGILCALQRCLLDFPGNICNKLDSSLTDVTLELLENISELLLGVLYGNQESCDKAVAPSFCDMGNAISTLIGNATQGGLLGSEECVLLSEEHSLVLTCCWVSLKEIGIFLGSLVERVLTQSEASNQLFTKSHLKRASIIFWNILLKCRQWGAVEGCGIGFTKFCLALLRSNDPELKEIPADMLKQVLQVIASPRSTSVTRRAAGIPMLILCALSAEEASKGRPLLVHSVEFLLDTAKTPLPEIWDQTLDLPQVCAVHTLQALVRGTALGSAILQFASTVAILSLTLLSSSCWAMRNAALQLYSSLSSRMLGHCPSGEDNKSPLHRMSSTAFFGHYSTLQPFLIAELKEAALVLKSESDEARLHLKPSLFPILTLLAQLHPGVQESAQSCSDLLQHLFQLSSSPIYNVRIMASRALVALTPPSEIMTILLTLVEQLPSPEKRYCHNWLHGHLLQIKALLKRAICNQSPITQMHEVVIKLEASFWLATEAQRCPLLRATYIAVMQIIKSSCSEPFLSKLNVMLTGEIQKHQREIQIGLSSFHEKAVHFICSNHLWIAQIWERFCALNMDVKLILVKWTVEGCNLQPNKELIHRVLQENLRDALLSRCVEYRRVYLEALVKTATLENALVPQHTLKSTLEEPVFAECLQLLFEDVEAQRGGPEFLCQALCALTLLLRHCVSTLEQWCQVLENYCLPNAPEVLRMACAEALILGGTFFMNHSLSKGNPAIMIRLVNTSLYLLQDQSVDVRTKAAYFASTLKHSGAQGSIYVMQINKAIPFLLNLLVDCAGCDSVEVLLSHLPQPDLTSVHRSALQNRCVSLYEQDEANVFAEPSVMCAQMLPCLLLLADKGKQCPSLAQRFIVWAKESGPQVLEDLQVCKDLSSAEMQTWLTLLVDPRFHSALCGLMTRAALLMRLMKSSSGLPDNCAPVTLPQTVHAVSAVLRENGVHFPPSLSAAVTEELST